MKKLATLIITLLLLTANQAFAKASYCNETNWKSRASKSKELAVIAHKIAPKCNARLKQYSEIMLDTMYDNSERVTRLVRLKRKLESCKNGYDKMENRYSKLVKRWYDMEDYCQLAEEQHSIYHANKLIKKTKKNRSIMRENEKLFVKRIEEVNSSIEFALEIIAYDEDKDY